MPAIQGKLNYLILFRQRLIVQLKILFNVQGHTTLLVLIDMMLLPEGSVY